MTAIPADPSAGGPPDDQYERTLLAWRRTVLALIAAGLVVSHLATQRIGPVGLVVSLIGTAAVLGSALLSHERRIGAAGMTLVMGVLLLGVTALAAIAAR